ncbi:MAG: hypothetical protein HQK52_12850 [Oligoflexia bacterium]|nr:hypothetical protein [Oligoflexia bacterium]
MPDWIISIIIVLFVIKHLEDRRRRDDLLEELKTIRSYMSTFEKGQRRQLDEWHKTHLREIPRDSSFRQSLRELEKISTYLRAGLTLEQKINAQKAIEYSEKIDRDFFSNPPPIDTIPNT